MTKIRKDKKGRVLHKGECYKSANELYCFSYTDPLGKRRCVYAQELDELREKEKQLQRDKLDELDVYLISKADVNFLFDRYIATKKELRNHTRSNYVYTFEKYVRNGFGKRKISDVRYSDVLLFYGELTKTLSVSTIDSVHTVLHPAFQMAVRDNIIRNNPTDGALAEIKRAQKGRPEPRHALSIEQQREFLDWIERPENIRWKPFFTVMFGTGCRIGEIIGLRWEDVDFANNLISVNHSVSYYKRRDDSYKCEFELSLPKTASGIRTIPMLDKVREAFLLEKKMQDEYGYKCTVELGGMSGFIFCNRFNNMCSPPGINRLIKRMVADHNAYEEIQARRESRPPVMIPNFSCHIARHTFCTRLCENETNIKVIQSTMGHKDIQTTLDIYAEVSESKKQEAFKLLNQSNVF